MIEPFDAIADAYDQWYDAPEGRAIFQAEVACLRLASSGFRGRWLEIGVGTGRFASALGVPEGVDPSGRMLAKAARRGIRVYRAAAEHLPFSDGLFDGALVALTFCFVQDAAAALRECARVLASEGVLLVGTIPADGPWGRADRRKAQQGHPLYSLARFRTVPQFVALARCAGFERGASASTMLWEPDSGRIGAWRVEPGICHDAAFSAILFAKAGVARAELKARKNHP